MQINMSGIRCAYLSFELRAEGRHASRDMKAQKRAPILLTGEFADQVTGGPALDTHCMRHSLNTMKLQKRKKSQSKHSLDASSCTVILPQHFPRPSVALIRRVRWAPSSIHPRSALQSKQSLRCRQTEKNASLNHLQYRTQAQTKRRAQI